MFSLGLEDDSDEDEDSDVDVGPNPTGGHIKLTDASPVWTHRDIVKNEGDGNLGPALLLKGSNGIPR